MAQAQRILGLLESDCEDWVPSHRDPVLGNLLLTDNRLWLIDWEYSAMASPYWDLAILCNEAELDLAQSRLLLQAYCADGPAMQESKLFDYRGLLRLLSDCWMAALADL
jgi:thiamine kinase-like enzyme